MKDEYLISILERRIRKVENNLPDAHPEALLSIAKAVEVRFKLKKDANEREAFKLIRRGPKP